MGDNYKWLVVVNPMASVGNSGKDWPVIRQNLVDAGIDFDDMDRLRKECTELGDNISDDCRVAQESAQEDGINLDTLLLTVHVLQEFEQLTGLLSQMLRGMIHFEPSSSF